MVSVPLRAPAVLAATLYVTVPLPVPLAPAVIVSHAGLLLDAVHVHPELVDTATVRPVAAAALADRVVGLIEYVHDGAPGAAWLTVNVWPPMVAIPTRAAPVLAAAFNVTVPLPLPLAPDAIVSHAGVLLVAVHVHPAAVDTATLIPVAAAAEIDWLVGLIEMVHDGGGVEPPAAA